MPHIAVRPDLPGILGLLDFRQDVAGPLNELAEVVLRGPGSLPRGERELIAAYVSAGNECEFCADAHGAVAAAQLDGGAELVAQVRCDPESAPISQKLRSLLRIAGKVRQSGRLVTEEDVANAREAGATDNDIHDTVLIAAMFSLYNRYVDGLGTLTPPDPAFYTFSAKMITEYGYRGVATLERP